MIKKFETVLLKLFIVITILISIGTTCRCNFFLNFVINFSVKLKCLQNINLL